MSKKLKWVIEFRVDKSLVRDGYNLTQKRALDMLAHDLNLSHANAEMELGAKILKAPPVKLIKKLQEGE